MDSLTSSSNTPRKSLNLPAQPAPPVLHATSYPTVQSALDAMSYPTVQSTLHSYTQHPEVSTLNQVMLYYLGIEEILKLYRHNYVLFETRQTLGILSFIHKLPTVDNFKQLLRAYDMQYATVRSYLYNNRSPEEILQQAALEGDIQALYNQLKLYPELRNIYVYTPTLHKAAAGGHRAIMNLLLELGANKGVILNGAAEGGHLDIIKEEVAKLDKGRIKRLHLDGVANLAAANNRMEVLDYILSVDTSTRVLSYAMQGAGISGSIAMIEYLVAKSSDYYAALVEGTVEGDHFELFKQYYGKVGPGDLYYIFQTAIHNLRLDVVKYLCKRKVVYEDDLVEALEELKYDYKNYARQIANPEKPSSKELAELARKIEGARLIIEYLECHGVTNEEGEHTNEVSSDSG